MSYVPQDSSSNDDGIGARPLLSVIIPTHNRARYALFSVKSLLSIKDPRLQIVVHDTSERPDLENGMQEFSRDERLLYVHRNIRLNLTGNHNAAMQLASGEYVCLIGDDDTILPDAVEAAAWASRNGIDCIAPKIVANYVWPDFKTRWFGSGHAGRVYFRSRFGGTRIVKSDDALQLALGRAAQGTDDLPKIYHGIVKREILEGVRRRTGAYFHGASPDVSGAIAIAVVAPTFLELDYPLTLAGASGGSASGRAAINAHEGALRSTDQTACFADADWPSEIPGFFSVETVWAHAAVTTLMRLAPSRVERFNFLRLYGLCLLRHANWADEIRKSARAYAAKAGVSEARLRLGLASETLAIGIQTASRLARRSLRPTAAGGKTYVANISDISEAQRVAVQRIAESDANLDSLLAATTNHGGSSLGWIIPR